MSISIDEYGAGTYEIVSFDPSGDATLLIVFVIWKDDTVTVTQVRQTTRTQTEYLTHLFTHSNTDNCQVGVYYTYSPIAAASTVRITMSDTPEFGPLSYGATLAGTLTSDAFRDYDGNDCDSCKELAITLDGTVSSDMVVGAWGCEYYLQNDPQWDSGGDITELVHSYDVYSIEGSLGYGLGATDILFDDPSAYTPDHVGMAAVSVKAPAAGPSNIDEVNDVGGASIDEINDTSWSSVSEVNDVD